jgi:hemoglobin-like flavoprotein
MDKDLLERSLALVAGEEDALTRRFYDVLFTRYPQVRPMFSSDVRPQAAMLREAVVAVIDHLDDAQWLESTLHGLGARHEGLGVTAPMYAAVAECMIATMEERGGSQWTPEMTAAWTEALGAVATMMLDGYREAESVA